MAKRTIRRNPMSVDADDYKLNEQYFNFSEFKGINSNKNYLGIDQQSFEDAANVYVDQNNQLSTRPATKQLDILPVDEDVIKLVKVNNLTIYQTKDSSGNYLIRFKIDKWYEHQVTEKFHVCWYKDKYLLFTESNLEAWSFDYSTNTITWWATSQIVYTPVTEIISGNVITKIESDNIFTTGYIIRYDFEANKTTITTDLAGKTVTIQIGEEVFENVVWKQNYEVVLTKPMGSIICNRICAASAAGEEGGYRYFAYTYDSPSNIRNLYLSLDGNLFVALPIPEAYGSLTYTLSDDGLRILAYTTELSGYTSDGLWYFDIPNSLSMIPTTSWVHIWSGSVSSSAKFKFELNAADPSKTSQHSTRFTLSLMGGRVIPIAHAPDSTHVVFVCGGQIEYKDLQNTALTWTDPDNPVSGTVSSGSEDVLAVVICTYTGTGAWSGWKVEGYPLRYFVNSVMNGYLSHSVRYTITDSNSYIGLFMLASGTPANILPYYIALNSDFTPYFSIDFTNKYVTPVLLKYNSTQVLSSLIYINSTDVYGLDVANTYLNGHLLHYLAFNGGYSANSQLDTILTADTYDWAFISGYNATDYVYKYTFSSSSYDSKHRDDYPLDCEFSYTYDVSVSTKSTKFKLSYGSTKHLLTDKYFVYGTSVAIETNILPLLERPANGSTKYEVIPLYVTDDGVNFGYYSIGNNTLYSNNYEGHIYVDYKEAGGYNYFVPEYSCDLIDKILAWDNYMYWTSARVDDNPNSAAYNKQLLYVSSKNVNEFEDLITNLVVFSQTSIGVFLSNSVYEFQYSETLSDSTGENTYILTPTKLQMGCKKGSDIVIAYNSSQILLTNIKGLTILTYQDFVQSTERVFTYLTENIMSDFYEWSKGPIKLFQYKDWLFVYQTTDKVLFVYDVRSGSWWRWDLPYAIQSCVTTDEDMQFIMNNTLYKFDFDVLSVYDNDVTPFNWYFRSQKLHFNAPNYYKVIKQLSVITSQEGRELRYKLSFKNYHNVQNLTDTVTVEYNIDQLNTLIQRVTFMKLNAFQFEISNDKTNYDQTPFVISDIAIQYRITERVR